MQLADNRNLNSQFVFNCSRMLAMFIIFMLGLIIDAASKSSCHVTSTYVPSKLEKIQRLHHISWTDDYCSFYNSQEDVRRSLTTAVLHVVNKNKNLVHVYNSDPEVLCHMRHHVNCGSLNYTFVTYIEPLYSIIRNVYAVQCPGFTASPTLMDIDYLIPADSYSLALKQTKSNILFDLGASDWAGLSQTGLQLLYRTRGIRFDRHLMWEAKSVVMSDLLAHVPADEIPSYQYFNVPATADPLDARNPLNILLNVAEVDDFVVLKLDIDNSLAELSYIDQIFASTAVSSRIDEFYWEPHFNVPALIECCWKTSANKSLSLSDVVSIFTRLRTLGIRAHGWP